MVSPRRTRPHTYRPSYTPDECPNRSEATSPSPQSHSWFGQSSCRWSRDVSSRWGVLSKAAHTEASLLVAKSERVSIRRSGRFLSAHATVLSSSRDGAPHRASTTAHPSVSSVRGRAPRCLVARGVARPSLLSRVRANGRPSRVLLPNYGRSPSLPRSLSSACRGDDQPSRTYRRRSAGF